MATLARYFNSQNRMIFWVALFITFTGNYSMFVRILTVYPATWENLPFLLSLAAFFSLATIIVLLLLCYGRLTRWVLMFFLLAAALAAYYMDEFGVIIDVVMLDNIRQTNPQELAGVLSIKLLIRVIVFGLLPAWFVFRYTPKTPLSLKALQSKLSLVLGLTLLLAVVVVPFTAAYSTFIREHRTLRMYANPTFFTYSLVKYAAELLTPEPSGKLTRTAEDATMIGTPNKKELIIVVVGETARADRFSLNGYHRITNPELAKQAVVSLSNVSSCGTSTSISVPCMFSILTRKEFSKEKAKYMENALDVLRDHGVEVLWRDNNSDSKDVATRVRYEDFKTPTLNPVCDSGECRDIGMLGGLDKYIAARKDKDILIVLHQMGNHGPEYYRRYPKAFERFKPMCMTGDIRKCSQAEIDNAYDNAILYTDYFLSNVINFLKHYDDTRETAMLYVSDHGESLGEHGFYLHAAPYVIAPKEQTHVPAIIWLGKNFAYSIDELKPYKDQPFSHDDLYCTLLVSYEIKSKVCTSKDALLMDNADLKKEFAK